MPFNLIFLMRSVLAIFYFGAGVVHIISPSGFIKIVPHFVPWPAQVVFVTGLCEIAGALGLLLPTSRKAAGIGLALYAVCVFPANVKHALEGSNDLIDWTTVWTGKPVLGSYEFIVPRTAAYQAYRARTVP